MDIDLTLSTDEIRLIVKSIEFYAELHTQLYREAKKTGQKITKEELKLDAYADLLGKLAFMIAPNPQGNA